MSFTLRPRWWGPLGSPGQMLLIQDGVRGAFGDGGALLRAVFG
jgi:hypothetical protein